MGDGRFYSKNENDKAGASIYGGGFGTNIKLPSGTWVNFHIKFLGGGLKDDIDRNIESLETGVQFMFEI